MKNIYIVKFILLAFFLVFLFGCDKEQKKIENRQTEKNETVSNTVKIGNQEWMAENLNVDTYRNGDPIPHVQDAGKWSSLTSGAWCYYENNSGNGITYGKLYNWYAVTDSRGLAPKGWHVPSDNEFATIVDFHDGIDKAGKKMKSTSGWFKNGNGTNVANFNALPSGARNSNGEFANILKYCYFWTSSEGKRGNDSYYRSLGYDLSGISIYHTRGDKKNGMSVRCIKD